MELINLVSGLSAYCSGILYIHLLWKMSWVQDSGQKKTKSFWFDYNIQDVMSVINFQNLSSLVMKSICIKTKCISSHFPSI